MKDSGECGQMCNGLDEVRKGVQRVEHLQGREGFQCDGCREEISEEGVFRGVRGSISM